MGPCGRGCRPVGRPVCDFGLGGRARSLDSIAGRSGSELGPLRGANALTDVKLQPFLSVLQSAASREMFHVPVMDRHRVAVGF